METTAARLRLLTSSHACVSLGAHNPGFAERLLSRLRQTNEGFPVRLLMMDVISRLVSTHQLLLLEFYPFMLKFIQPQQKEVRGTRSPSPDRGAAVRP